MRRIAEDSGAQYTWIEPKGTYPAMAESIDLVPQESYVWWINSSDWLAGPKSIQLVSEFLTSSKAVQPAWLVGQLIRLKDDMFAQSNPGHSGELFVSRLKAGRIGFPHPAAVFWLPDLRRVQPFEDRLAVAADYSTALRFASRFGAPEMLPHVLSIHTLTGVSAKYPVRNFFEKTQARWMASNGVDRLLEPFRTIVNAWHGAFGFLRKEPRTYFDPRDQEFPLGMNGHFCSPPKASGWPSCCDRVLEELGWAADT
jgi:hypothetical protein